ncbi:hypothetical protein [Bacillus thuringiensis]|uniref:hypothetical protein n=1 Tax=Bacillus thuringiensis TaxID=1428 RepID=UPI000BFDA8AD|nr:hypothetical protein [Bacillus thuringiensis]PGT89991.1 hypothetical protein COD17_09585 [Bacillus thuringiensis]
MAEEQQSIEERLKEHMTQKVNFLSRINASRVDSLNPYLNKQGSHDEVHFLSGKAKALQTKKNNDLF